MDRPEVKRAPFTSESVQDQLRKKPDAELLDLLRVARIQLGDFGIGHAPAMVINMAKPSLNGHWEDKRDEKGRVKATALNCLMAVLKSDPHLRQLPEEQFAELADTVSVIAMVNEEFLSRTDGQYTWVKWPADLGRDPRVARAEHAPFADEIKPGDIVNILASSFPDKKFSLYSPSSQ